MVEQGTISSGPAHSPDTAQIGHTHDPGLQDSGLCDVYDQTWDWNNKLNFKHKST